MEPLSYKNYIETRVQTREKLLRKRIVAEYMDSHGITSALERSKESTEYRKTEAYRKTEKEVLANDPVLKKLLADPPHGSLGKEYKAYVKSFKLNEKNEKKKQERKSQAREILMMFVKAHETELLEYTVQKSRERVDSYLSNGKHAWPLFGYGKKQKSKRNLKELSIDTFEEYVAKTEEAVGGNLEAYLQWCSNNRSGIIRYAMAWYKEHGQEERKEVMELLDHLSDVEYELAADCLYELDFDYNVEDALHEIFTEKYVRKLLLKNPKLSRLKKELEEKEEADRLLEQDILKTIPENIKDIYPGARRMKRHFIIHAGPTNSGKTYHAMEAFREAETGVYMAPLRLLAYEIYEAVNEKGVICSLKTGEEEISMPGAYHVAQTIETLDLREHYEVAVIDEAQLLEDPQRGGAWSSAIMGVKAEEIHVCTAEYAVPMLKRLIEYCEDTYEIIYTKRMTRLSFENDTFRFPDDIQDGDALIVFSKTSVLNCAARLQQSGIPCSIIYGNLPHDVRKQEAKRFMEGETKVVVSTDAIGMGMNLPIRRVIFLETMKYDGIRRRQLRAPEIQQIAGRAGRWGKYEEGLCNALFDRGLISGALNQKIAPIRKIRLSFPGHLLRIEGTVSAIMEKWASLPCEEFFEKENLEEALELCRILEPETDDKELIYQLSMIPFNQKNNEVKRLWKHLFYDLKEHAEIELASYRELLEKPPHVTAESNRELLALETIYQKCDLMFYALNLFGRLDQKEYDKLEVMQMKKDVSKRITEELKKQNLDIQE